MLLKRTLLGLFNDIRARHSWAALLLLGSYRSYISGRVKQLLHQYQNKQSPSSKVKYVPYYSPGPVFLPEQGHAEVIYTSLFSAQYWWLGDYVRHQNWGCSDLLKQHYLRSLHNENRDLDYNFWDTCTNYLQSYWFPPLLVTSSAVQASQAGLICIFQGHFTSWVPGTRSSGAGSRRLYSILTWGFKHASLP